MNNRILVIALLSLLLLSFIGGSSAYALKSAYCERAYEQCKSGCTTAGWVGSVIGALFNHPEAGLEAFGGCRVGCLAGYMNCGGGN
jgi:hypothetical protein